MESLEFGGKFLGTKHSRKSYCVVKTRANGIEILNLFSRLVDEVSSSFKI